MWATCGRLEDEQTKIQKYSSREHVASHLSAKQHGAKVGHPANRKTCWASISDRYNVLIIYSHLPG
jgi:hypothetical protein